MKEAGSSCFEHKTCRIVGQVMVGLNVKGIILHFINHALIIFKQIWLHPLLYICLYHNFVYKCTVSNSMSHFTRVYIRSSIDVIMYSWDLLLTGALKQANSLTTPITSRHTLKLVLIHSLWSLSVMLPWLIWYHHATNDSFLWCNLLLQT